MSYHVYTTEGFILKGLPSGEADKFFYIFTRELGLIFASAKSVRVTKSKLAPALRDFSSGEFSFVKGKHRWKITHASSFENFFDIFRSDKEKLQLCARVFSFLPTCIAGEEINKELFAVVDTALRHLKETVLTQEEMFLFECVLILRILSHLGYVVSRGEYASILEDERWDTEVFSCAHTHKNIIVKDINRSLKESQM